MWNGSNGAVCSGWAGKGLAGRGLDRQERRAEAGTVMGRLGGPWREWLAKACLGGVDDGVAAVALLGVVCKGVDGKGSKGLGRSVLVRMGKHGKAVEWQDRTGSEGRAVVCDGLEGQQWCVMAGSAQASIATGRAG